MTTYQYITTQLTPQQFRDMIRGGLINSKFAQYVEIYEYWREHGRSEQATADYFKQSRSNVGYIIRQMKRQIL